MLIRQALADCKSAAKITSVTDVREALDLLGSGAEFDVVILDLNLPKLNGFEFLERAKRTFPPVVVFTSSHSDYDEKRALALGARQFVRKPMSYDGYVQAVCRLVQKWASRRDATAPAT